MLFSQFDRAFSAHDSHFFDIFDLGMPAPQVYHSQNLHIQRHFHQLEKATLFVGAVGLSAHTPRGGYRE